MSQSKQSTDRHGRARAALCCCALILLAGPAARAQDVEVPVGDGDYDELSLDEISQQLENPLSKLWSLTIQDNLTLNEGYLIGDTEVSNTALFQPAMPIPFGDDKVFIARPVFPLVTAPVLDPAVPGGVSRHTTGLGDIQMLALFGPDRSDGLVWGVGGTFKFPTATSDSLGAGKWQAGPAFMLLNLGDKWTTGIVLQHWWSFAGDGNRAHTNRTELQYILRRRLPNAWSIGMGPTVVADWSQDSDNRFTVPIGLGITKTVRIFDTPVKIRLEPQYSLIRPDKYGAEWNIRLQFTPVIDSPFLR